MVRCLRPITIRGREFTRSLSLAFKAEKRRANKPSYQLPYCANNVSFSWPHRGTVSVSRANTYDADMYHKPRTAGYGSLCETPACPPNLPQMARARRAGRRCTISTGFHPNASFGDREISFSGSVAAAARAQGHPTHRAGKAAKTGLMNQRGWPPSLLHSTSRSQTNPPPQLIQKPPTDSSRRGRDVYRGRICRSKA